MPRRPVTATMPPRLAWRAAGAVVGAGACALGEQPVSAITPANVIDTSGSREPGVDEQGAWLRGPPWKVNAARRSLRRTVGFVPGTNQQVAEGAERPEHQQTEQRRQSDRREQLLRLEAGAVVVDQSPDARITLAEEEVANDRADDR